LCENKEKDKAQATCRKIYSDSAVWFSSYASGQRDILVTILGALSGAI